MSNKNQPVMEINGKSYAANGEVIKPIKVGRTLNDMVASKTTKPLVTSAAKTPMKPFIPANVKPDISPVKHAAPHKPQKAQTLMRTAVKKPAPGLKRQTKAQTPTTLSALAPITGNTPSKHLAMDMARRGRAQGASKSSFISKFSKGTTVSRATTPTQFASAAITNNTAAPIVRNSPKRSMDVFERALAKANAHQQPAFDPKKQAKLDKKLARHASQHVHHKRWGRRFAAGVSIIIVIAVLAGFVAYQNRTNLELHLASAKAGFDATIPSYHPSGYSLNDLQYGDGYVTMNFHSNDANRTYKLNQQSTNWDSRTLLDNYISTKNESYQTIQKAGRTIYLYGNNNASWVDSGVLYKVDSGNSLSTTDVLNIASSL